ncbi:MAG: hypothetical protein KC482_09385, partial [Dehalococcoidia bacterium]|nr:hypothetical protein [Dehalococcoidia bacterium]
TAEVVNTLKRAKFMIQKSFLWNGVPLANQPGESFYICIKGPSFPSGTSAGACKVVSTTDTAPIILLWEDLIPGNYMVGEFQGQGFNTTPVDNDPAWEVTISPTQYDLNPGENPGNAHVLVDNEYQLAGLVVTKVVDWGEQVEDNTQTFTICIEGPSYTLPADAAEACQDADSNGGALTWTNLIPGDYTVTENDPGAEWGVSGDDVTVDAPAGGEGKHTITNTILEGDLNVVKTIAWNGAPGDASQTFEICIQGPTYPNGNETGACQDVNPGNTTAQWKDLEVGAYTVTENFPDGDSAEWTTTVDGVSGTTGSATVATGTPARVEIVNTLRQGRVIVHKLYDFPGGTPDNSWQPVVTVNGDNATPNGLYDWDPVDVPANQPIDVTELLPDGWTSVRVTFDGQCGQQSPQNVIDNLINQALSLVGLDVGVLSAELAGDTVMVTPGGDCEVTFENRAVGTVEVTKVDQTTAGGTWNFDLDAPER